jgi:hypothetical protein
MQQFKQMEVAVRTAPDQQISLTDPDARSMATSGKGTGIVGYNVQTAVDVEHHLIVAHEVTNVGHDRTQLVPMALKAQEAIDDEIADGDDIFGDGLNVAPWLEPPAERAKAHDGTEHACIMGPSGRLIDEKKPDELCVRRSGAG